MNDDEINEIIAKFVGSNGYIPHISGMGAPIQFTRSLDVLIPVVEKLVDSLCLSGWCMNLDSIENIYWAGLKHNEMYAHKDKSPSGALAMACAEVIKK